MLILWTGRWSRNISVDARSRTWCSSRRSNKCSWHVAWARARHRRTPSVFRITWTCRGGGIPGTGRAIETAPPRVPPRRWTIRICTSSIKCRGTRACRRARPANLENSRAAAAAITMPDTIRILYLPRTAFRSNRVWSIICRYDVTNNIFRCIMVYVLYRIEFVELWQIDNCN